MNACSKNAPISLARFELLQMLLLPVDRRLPEHTAALQLSADDGPLVMGLNCVSMCVCVCVR